MWFETGTFWGFGFVFIQSAYLGLFALLHVSHLATQPWLGTTHEPFAPAFRAVGHEVSATTPSFLLCYVALLVFETGPHSAAPADLYLLCRNTLAPQNADLTKIHVQVKSLVRWLVS